MTTYTVLFQERGRWTTALTTRIADKATRCKRRLARSGKQTRILRLEAMKVAA